MSLCRSIYFKKTRYVDESSRLGSLARRTITRGRGGFSKKYTITAVADIDINASARDREISHGWTVSGRRPTFI